MPFVLLAVTILIFIMTGMLMPVKIPAIIARYRKINIVFRQKMDVEIKDLKETYADFSDLTMINVGLSVVFIFLIATGMAGTGLYNLRITGGLTPPELKLILKVILVASVIAIILCGMTALILTEYMTYRERSDLYNEIVKNGEIIRPYSLYSISVYFMFYAFLLLIIIFSFSSLFERLKMADKTNLIIFTYMLGSILCVFYVAMIHTKSVRRVINDIAKVTEGLVSGRREWFRYVSLCSEFSSAQHSLMLTGREMDLSRKNLELVILERTDELEKALDTARHKDDLLKKQLDTAGITQQNLPILKIEDWNEIKFSLDHKKVKKLGGDYFDIFHINNNKNIILLADVQGNDMQSSIIATMLKIFFPAAINNSDSPGKIFREVNYNIISYFKTNYSVDCFIAVIDDNCYVTYSCAGNMKPLIARKGVTDPETLAADNRALGADEKNIGIFKEEKIKLEYGDRLIIFTDGIPSTRNFDNEEYTLERFIQSIINHRELDTDSFTEALISDVNNHRGSIVQFDDISLIVIEPVPDEAVEIIKSSQKLNDSFKYLEAVELLENGLEKYPDNLQILYHLGKNYFKVDNYNSALNVLERYLELNSKNKYVFYVTGACYYQTMDYKKAIENFNSAISIDPFFTQALFALGMSYKNIADYDIALEIFHKVSDIDPDNKMSLYEIGQIEKLKTESAS
jgi:serine phosphatase RsbU (regulator of sigma subunit)